MQAYRLTLTTHSPAVVSHDPRSSTHSQRTYLALFFSVFPGDHPGAPPLEDLGEQFGDLVVFNVDFPAGAYRALKQTYICVTYFLCISLFLGTSIGIEIKDSTGAIALTAPVTVLPSCEWACLCRSQGVLMKTLNFLCCSGRLLPIILWIQMRASLYTC
jgi:hypothetical protein